MRVIIAIDSADDAEISAFVDACQRAKGYNEPSVLNDKPTIERVGLGWTVSLPPMSLARALEVLGQFPGLIQGEALDRQS